MGRSSIPDWAPYRRMSPLLWLWFVIRSTWVMTVLDNPLSWFLGFRGTKNRFDDIEGPFFLQGAPGVQVDEGQAVLSLRSIEFDPFLLVLCTGNDPVHMSHDVANKFRPRPDGNMAICWATEDPKDGKSYFDLPKLPQEDVDMADAINRWNAKLKEQGLWHNYLAFW